MIAWFQNLLCNSAFAATPGHGDEVEERIYSSVMELSDNVHRLKQARRAASEVGGVSTINVHPA